MQSAAFSPLLSEHTNIHTKLGRLCRIEHTCDRRTEDTRNRPISIMSFNVVLYVLVSNCNNEVRVHF